MIFVGPEHLETFDSGLHADVCPLLGLLSHFQILLRNSAFIEQDLGARQLGGRQPLLRDGLPVVREHVGKICALYAHQKLPFLNGVAQPRADLHDPPGSHRNHGHAARNVDTDNAGNAQLRGAGTP